MSISHPDGIKKVLLAPLEKASWYKAMAIPDYRFQTPHSETDPKRKVAMSRNFAAGYTMANLLHNERHIDEMVELFLGWVDRFAESGKPMDLGLCFTFTTSDIMSVHQLLEQMHITNPCPVLSMVPSASQRHASHTRCQFLGLT